MASNGVDALWFLPGALNVKVLKFNKAQVSGGGIWLPQGSQMPRHLISGEYERISEIPVVPTYYLVM